MLSHTIVKLSGGHRDGLVSCFALALRACASLTGCHGVLRDVLGFDCVLSMSNYCASRSKHGQHHNMQNCTYNSLEGTHHLEIKFKHDFNLLY